MIKVQNVETMIPESAIPKLDQPALNGIASNVAAAGRNHWLRLASGDTSSFKADYIQGIQEVSVKGNDHIISLVGEVAHQIEEGAPRLDMRDTLLGPEVPVAPMGERGKHLSKNKQFFRAIPIRHTTPGSGKAIGQAMGSAYRGHNAVADSKKLGKAVYRAAKALETTKTTPYGEGGKTKWGGRLNTSRLRSGLKKGVRGVPLLKPHHKSSIYEGMVRFEKTYEKATQHHYGTFRTISTAVRDGSWIRKAIEPRHYAEKVSTFVAKLLPEAISAYLEAK
jgi:hypothetical protein